jgi:hypothetical protein
MPEEYRLFHREDGSLVKENDDAISPSRYALMMRRLTDFLEAIIARARAGCLDAALGPAG